MRFPLTCLVLFCACRPDAGADKRPDAAAPLASATVDTTPTAAQVDATQPQVVAAPSGTLIINPDPIPRDPTVGTVTTAPTATGDVTVGATSATVPIPNVARTLAGLRPGFRACYQQGLEGDSVMRGNFVLTLHVAPNGDVTSTAVKSSNWSISAAVSNCIEAEAQKGQFTAPGRASVLTVTLTLAK